MDAASQADLELLAEQQAALRRIATLVAGGADATELYSAVVAEAALVLDISAVILARYESDATATVLAQLNEPTFPIGSNWPIDGPSVTAVVRDTGRPARVDDYSRLPGAIATSVRGSPMRATVGVPIRVDGEVWGLLTVASDEATTMPADTESRLADFAELLATGISNAYSHERLQRVLAQQAALRRVATLVAQESSPVDIFRAVTEEAAGVLETEAVGLLRVEPDGFVSLVAQSAAPWDPPPVGTRLGLDGDNVIVDVVRTGQAARVDDWTGATGSLAELATALGVRSCLATPIAVEGRLWGVMVTASARSDPLPADTQTRCEQFTELIATAIANAESRRALGVLLDEQAALRKVAVLVAEHSSPDEVFTAVTEAVAPLLHADLTMLHVFGDDQTATTIAGWTSAGPLVPLGTRLPLDGDSAAARIRRTGAPARIDSYVGADGDWADLARSLGLRSTVGAPIFVDGRMWGALMAATRRAEPFPHDAETRIAAFTELVATAIANAESQSALAASRMRLVAAADAARRRIERDLHDGIQQQLISLGMVLGAVEASLPADEGLGPQVAAVSSGLRRAIDDLREISRGIHPAILADGGLAAALKTLARRSSVPARLTTAIEGRLPEGVEVAAYYVVSEALTNVARHSDASAVTIQVASEGASLEISIRDDGAGGADMRSGTGLIGLKDRVEALGGRMRVDSPPGRGTFLAVTLPLADEDAAGLDA